MTHERSYDFIVIGGGPAGCTLAASLARSAKQPSVLLLEAGGRNDDKSQRVDGKRWTTFMESQMNWGSQTTPQEHCNGRQLDYSRGKGLGGGSAINFGVYAVGARDDYDQCAAAVDDRTFAWDNMQSRIKGLESFSGGDDLLEHQKYGWPDWTSHGRQGDLHVGYAREWDSDLTMVLDAFEQAGAQRNLDHNSGNPLGFGLCINSAAKGVRSTAADLLANMPDNLVILSDSPVKRIILDGKKAVGAKANGREYFALKEVILSAGALESPKILMHSGIGPADELSKFNIPVVQNLPAVGQGLRDHIFVPLIVRRDPITNDRNAFYQSPAAMDAAMEQWVTDGTGPWARHGCQLGIGWFKSDRITSSTEFQALPESVQEFMNRETIPHYEIISHFPVHFVLPHLFQDYSYICLPVFLMNEQSLGEVRLQSDNPDDPLLFNPRFLEHPFDRRACIEIYRHVWDLTKQPSFAKDTTSTIMAPVSSSDEDILEFWRNNLSSTWHMMGTVKMGREAASDAAVDSRFRVFGVQGLRVADLSVVPVLTNNHTQATAYMTGATCADVLICEYGLNSEYTRSDYAH